MKYKLIVALGVVGISFSAFAQTPVDAPIIMHPMQEEQETAPPPPHDHHEHAFTDAQIVAILKTANDGEISAGREEKNHGKSEEAKSFAKMMIDQHTQNNKDLKALEKKLQMHAEKTPMSDKIYKDAEASNARLDKMKGADLDRAYVDKQVEMHQHVLDKLDTVLIPQAKNEDLKSLLQSTRATVSEHLAHAEQVQRIVNGGTATSNQ